jgi:hypothetical protein
MGAKYKSGSPSTTTSAQPAIRLLGLFIRTAQSRKSKLVETQGQSQAQRRGLSRFERRCVRPGTVRCATLGTVPLGQLETVR